MGIYVAVGTYVSVFDVSWSHGGKGGLFSSLFDVHCRHYTSAVVHQFKNVLAMGCTARQTHIGVCMVECSPIGVVHYGQWWDG